jgi:hypothetical protein
MDTSDLYTLLQEYRLRLNELRRDYSRVRMMPAVSFFLFGMGARRKLIYQTGVLKDAVSGEILRSWDVASETIIPPAYTVLIEPHEAPPVKITENEIGIWLEEGDQVTALSESALNLPVFSGRKYAIVLRVLHQEVLINIIDGIPVPNFFVYPHRKPWYRDSAMMAMVLQATGNLGLIRDWILNFRAPYDRNNAGETETDNLGQALYLVSLVSDRSHPLVPFLLNELQVWQTNDYIKGRTDFSEHPVYQTKWAKYGLAALGIKDPYEVPLIPDSYSSLFWWAYKDRHLQQPRFNEMDYPYLDWAEAHFYDEKNGPVSGSDYPLSWEANASQANYAGMAGLSQAYTDQRLCAPHTWHAAEMFLCLLDV